MGILRRTVYYDISRGISMFWDWAKVTTTLGTMVEPFCVGQKHVFDVPTVDFDPDDEINRIDEIRALPIDKEQLILSSSAVDHLHGGPMVTRIGR